MSGGAALVGSAALLTGTAQAETKPQPPGSTRPWQPSGPTLGPDHQVLPGHPGAQISQPGKPYPSKPAPPRRITRALLLTFAKGAEPFPADRHTMLVCRSTTGDRPTSAAACRALDEAGGDPAKVEPAKGMLCPAIYDPVTVTATGTWDGKLIRYQHTFGNACDLNIMAGSVFAF
ncbi:SSI family serine proteinase inhibitor [Sinosporangium album]|nr:SSI family serine proteinase inhibitor [Sinosporangium album]